ncbi:MAG: hypothetical protein OEU36_07820 [Gammaproteobacteria bacterium]|nr:hypothetical protein [Gammaproteobacteria bacterium]
MADNQKPWAPRQMAWSSIVTVFAVIAIGFSWFGLPGFGWVTQGGANQMAQAAVTGQLIPICVAQARRAPEADLKALEATGTWEQRDFVERNFVERNFVERNFVEGKGRATMPGSSSPESGVATPCVDFDQLFGTGKLIA